MDGGVVCVNLKTAAWHNDLLWLQLQLPYVASAFGFCYIFVFLLSILFTHGFRNKVFEFWSGCLRDSGGYNFPFFQLNGITDFPKNSIRLGFSYEFSSSVQLARQLWQLGLSMFISFIYLVLCFKSLGWVCFVVKLHRSKFMLINMLFFYYPQFFALTNHACGPETNTSKSLYIRGCKTCEISNQNLVWTPYPSHP